MAKHGSNVVFFVYFLRKIAFLGVKEKISAE